MMPTQYSLFAGAAHDPRARLAAGLGEYDEMVSGDGRLLADLYGTGRVLAEGLLPRALIHDNPRFLRPCTARAGMPELRHLHAYCADIVRGPDGAWRVLADRLQAPAGIGFAL